MPELKGRYSRSSHHSLSPKVLDCLSGVHHKVSRGSVGNGPQTWIQRSDSAMPPSPGKLLTFQGCDGKVLDIWEEKDCKKAIRCLRKYLGGLKKTPCIASTYRLRHPHCLTTNLLFPLKIHFPPVRLLVGAMTSAAEVSRAWWGTTGSLQRATRRKAKQGLFVVLCRSYKASLTCD